MKRRHAFLIVGFVLGVLVTIGALAFRAENDRINNIEQFLGALSQAMKA